MKTSKRYAESAKLVDSNKEYEIKEALDIIEKMPKTKFDQTVELHVKLGVDSKHADQQVRGTVVLPNGTGKTQRVLVFAKGPKAEEATKAGADFVGAEELIPKIQNDNWFDYDVIVATPDMMGVVGRLGKVLGPKGLMPNPKSGTVTMDVTKAINEIKSGKVEYRLDKTNIIHLGFGKVSFGAEKLAENYDAIMGAIIKAKPAAAKGQYIRSVSVSTTMGPGLYINHTRSFPSPAASCTTSGTDISFSFTSITSLVPSRRPEVQVTCENFRLICFSSSPIFSSLLRIPV